MLANLFETGNKKTLPSFTHEYFLTTKGDSRVNLNVGRKWSWKRDQSIDEKWFKPRQRCDIEYFYCHKKEHIKGIVKKDWRPFYALMRTKKCAKEAKVIRTYNIKNDVIYVTTDDGFWDYWILHSACSFNACANKYLFDRYKYCDVGHVVKANGLRRKVASMGI